MTMLIILKFIFSFGLPVSLPRKGSQKLEMGRRETQMPIYKKYKKAKHCCKNYKEASQNSKLWVGNREENKLCKTYFMNINWMVK